MPRSRHASPTLNVKITAADHANAVRSHSGACLIADAIKRAYPNLTMVTVDMATVRATDRALGVRYTWLTPTPGQHILLAYDQGWPHVVEEFQIRRAVKINPVRRGESEAKKVERRTARVAELQAKEHAGTLTSRERRSLRELRTRIPAASRRPTANGPSEARVGSDGHVTVYGGEPIPLGPAHPNLLRGRDRHFGARLADPGLAFREAVNAEVAIRLEQQGNPPA